MAASHLQLSDSDLRTLGARQVLSMPLEMDVADATDGGVKQRRVSSLLYSGDAVERDFGRMVVNLATLKIPKKRAFPMLFSHARAGLCSEMEDAEVGVWENFTVSGTDIRGNGYLLNDNPRADRIANAAKQNYPWEQSIGMNDGRLELIPAGEKRVINGREFVGDGSTYSLEEATLREASICHVGADAGGSTAFELRSDEAINLFRDEGLSRSGPAKRRGLFRELMSRLSSHDRSEITQIVQELNAPGTVPAALSTGDSTMSAPAPVTPAAPVPATIEQLEALPGADDAFVLAAVKARLTLTDATGQLLGAMKARLAAAEKARDDAAQLAETGLKELKAAYETQLAEAAAKLEASQRAGGSQPLAVGEPPAGNTGGVPQGMKRIEGLSGTDPAADWEKSQELKDHWKNRGGKPAFLRFASMCKADREDYSLVAI